MGRIVEAVVPVWFNEVANVSAGHVQGLLESWLPGTTWYVVKDDYDLMVASIYPLGESFSGVFRSFPVVVETEALWGLPRFHLVAPRSVVVGHPTRRNAKASRRVHGISARRHDRRGSPGLALRVAHCLRRGPEHGGTFGPYQNHRNGGHCRQRFLWPGFLAPTGTVRPCWSFPFCRRTAPWTTPGATTTASTCQASWTTRL